MTESNTDILIVALQKIYDNALQLAADALAALTVAKSLKAVEDEKLKNDKGKVGD